MSKFLLIALSLMISLPAFSAETESQADEVPDMIESLNPFDPSVEEKLRELDALYEAETGLSPFVEDAFLAPKSTCRRHTCAVWIRISKYHQKLTLYINGWPRDEWPVSTGVRGSETPNFDRHPNGRIYTKYTSTKWPDGDYNGLGNMPYAIFIEGGFAVHGTPRGNWPYLGRPASHGCIRIHPDNAQYLNQLVRSTGIRNTWITVE